MLFMLTTRNKDSWYALAPEKQGEILGAFQQYLERWSKEGKVKALYMLGNMKGAVMIYDLGSSEEMARAAFEASPFPFVDAELTPLVEWDVVVKALAKK